MNQGTQQARKPVQQRGIQTKDKILKAAERLFSDKGFHKTNTKAIATEAGVATGSVYAYFKDKKSVFLEIYGTASHASFLERACRDIDVSGKTNREAILILLQRLAKEHTLSPGFRREVTAMRAQLVDTLRRREKACGSPTWTPLPL